VTLKLFHFTFSQGCNLAFEWADLFRAELQSSTRNGDAIGHAEETVIAGKLQSTSGALLTMDPHLGGVTI
jgi:hypothetical protein